MFPIEEVSCGKGLIVDHGLAGLDGPVFVMPWAPVSLVLASGGHMDLGMGAIGLPDWEQASQVGSVVVGKPMVAAYPGPGCWVLMASVAHKVGVEWVLPLGHWGGCVVARLSQSVLLTAWLK